MNRRLRLAEMVDQLDRLHENTWLDVRHRELFQNHALYLWPQLSDEIRRLLARAVNYLVPALVLPGPL